MMSVSAWLLIIVLFLAFLCFFNKLHNNNCRSVKWAHRNCCYRNTRIKASSLVMTQVFISSCEMGKGVLLFVFSFVFPFSPFSLWNETTVSPSSLSMFHFYFISHSLFSSFQAPPSTSSEGPFLWVKFTALVHLAVTDRFLVISWPEAVALRRCTCSTNEKRLD